MEQTCRIVKQEYNWYNMGLKGTNVVYIGLDDFEGLFYDSTKTQQ